MFISDFTFLRSKKGCTNYIKTPARKHSRTQTQEKSSNHVNINPWLFFELINYIPKPIAPKKQSLPFIGKRTWASLVAEKTNNITALGCCGLVEKWDIKQGNNYKTIYQLLQSDLLIPKWRSLKPQKEGTCGSKRGHCEEAGTRWFKPWPFYHFFVGGHLLNLWVRVTVT